jgi:hypothetical protein
MLPAGVQTAITSMSTSCKPEGFSVLPLVCILYKRRRIWDFRGLQLKRARDATEKGVPENSSAPAVKRNTGDWREDCPWLFARRRKTPISVTGAEQRDSLWRCNPAAHRLPQKSPPFTFTILW